MFLIGGSHGKHPWKVMVIDGVAGHDEGNRQETPRCLDRDLSGEKPNGCPLTQRKMGVFFQDHQKPHDLRMIWGYHHVWKP